VGSKPPSADEMLLKRPTGDDVASLRRRAGALEQAFARRNCVRVSDTSVSSLRGERDDGVCRRGWS